VSSDFNPSECVETDVLPSKVSVVDSKGKEIRESYMVLSVSHP
jgi:hypothetical protein